MPLFDTHCHLDDERFDEDRAEVIAAIKDQGFYACMCVGSDLPSSRRCIDLSCKYDFIYAAAGVHPHEAKDAPQDYLSQLAQLLALPRVKALGEIGLDYYYDLSPRDIQKKVCMEQIDLAIQMDKPVIFHIRDAHGDMIDLFRSLPVLPRGIIHCFSGSKETAKTYLDMGFYISFAGPVTFKNAHKLREAAASIPLDRLLIETDSPYLSPQPHRGQRNDPRNVYFVAKTLADLHGIPTDELIELSCENARKIYHI